MAGVDLEEARVIAVDLGASGGKIFAARLTAESISLEEIHRFSHEGVPLYVADRAGMAKERLFWDDLAMYSHILAGIRAYRRDFGERVDSIGITTWGSDGLLVDAEGTPRERMYCYRDHRLDGMVEEVKARIDAKRIYEITGIHFQPFNISNQLLWFRQNRAALLGKGARFLPLPTVFLYYLGGVTRVDSTWASVTQLMDARRKKWSREILRALGIPPGIMPPIVAPGTVVGELGKDLAASLGVSRARLVAVGSHDTASAYAAAPVVKPSGALIISSGTWSLIGMLVRRPVTTPEAMRLNISNEGGFGNVRLLKNCMGAWLAQSLRRTWRDRDGREMDWAELGSIAERAKPFTAFIDPDDRSFYNPPDMEGAIVEYCRKTGQDPPTDRGAILRAVLESLALNYRMVAGEIGEASGTPARIVHIVGGGSRNDALNQMTADACGLKVVAGPEEATAVGNAAVQGMALGIYKHLSHARRIIRASFPIREFRPKDTESWDRAYARFRAVVR